MNKQKTIQTFLFSFLIVFLAPFTGVQAKTKKAEVKLNFREDGTYKIVQFTDIHWEPGMPANGLTLQTMSVILDKEKPDLVVLTGDIVTAGDPVRGWKEVIQPMVDRKLAWISTYGNHDSEGDTPRSEINEIVESLPYNINKEVPGLSGEGNFSLPVYTKDQSIGSVLYFFDSHAYCSSYMPGSYNWVKTDQIEWYRKQSDEYRKLHSDLPVPSYAFLHIPLMEYREVAKSSELLGHKGEGVASPELNSGLFAAFVEQQDVIGTFCGHDHNNDYVGVYQDVALAYGRCTGTYAYGDLRNGARVIELHANDFHFKSWISTPREEDLFFVYPNDGNQQALEEAPLPAIELDKATLKQGLEYRYYEGPVETVNEIEKLPLIETGTTNNFSLEKAKQKDHFAFKFEGYIEVPETQTYRFYLLSDDGATLSIDDQLIVDNDGGHSARLRKGAANLSKGFHKITLLYFEDYMGEELEVGLSSLRIRQGDLSDTMLYYSPK
ncbi:PA14 domain-containing protein [Mangrovibacterium diazotrophicum]|uniref:PA14 domain-containing protein n=1 Tax=Mangrovibacterium diazotrophicum TaxID=1261403 RepID=A0A419VYX9_9BACT|nr:PA14 domain-containing protein [Mangrovibacterium diazotrophicum]RKD88270.1 PA14 domain-containing protein [Mangrovibacterium diazotrophicum]